MLRVHATHKAFNYLSSLFISHYSYRIISSLHIVFSSIFYLLNLFIILIFLQLTINKTAHTQYITMELDHDVQMEDVGNESNIEMTNDMESVGFTHIPMMMNSVPGEIAPQTVKQLDAWVEQLGQCRPLTEEDVETLCNMVCCC